MVDEVSVQPEDQLSQDDESDLDSTIRDAVEKQRKPESEPAPKRETVSDDRPRDEKGKFLPKEENRPESDEQPKAETAEEDVPDTKIAEGPSKPPAALSAAIKHKWDKIPEDVRAEFVKREADVAKGFEQFKRYDGLGQFADLAERNGTTLKNALTQYNQLENLFMRDPVSAVVSICQRLQMDPRILTSAMQAQFGGLLEPQTSSQPGTQTSGVNGYSSPQLNPEVMINEAVRRVNEEQSKRDINSQLESFMADPANKYFENVRQEMAGLLQAGLANTLKEAYEKALKLNPETYALMLQEQAASPQPRNPAVAATQARATAKAVGGSPRPGLKSGAAPDPNMSIEDTIRAAINAQRGAV